MPPVNRWQSDKIVQQLTILTTITVAEIDCSSTTKECHTQRPRDGMSNNIQLVCLVKITIRDQFIRSPTTKDKCPDYDDLKIVRKLHSANSKLIFVLSRSLNHRF